jgi:hypothetical protein
MERPTCRQRDRERERERERERKRVLDIARGHVYICVVFLLLAGQLCQLNRSRTASASICAGTDAICAGTVPFSPV